MILSYSFSIKSPMQMSIVFFVFFFVFFFDIFFIDFVHSMVIYIHA